LYGTWRVGTALQKHKPLDNICEEELALVYLEAFSIKRIWGHRPPNLKRRNVIPLATWQGLRLGYSYVGMMNAPASHGTSIEPAIMKGLAKKLS